MTVREYVIIGNGTAAVGCIEGIRSVDNDGKITVISKEDHHVYSRPLISYYLENKTDVSRMNTATTIFMTVPDARFCSDDPPKK